MSSYAHTFKHTVELTRDWVQSLARDLDWKDEQRAYRLLCVTLHALRDLLDINEAVQLGAQLPMLLRGIYYEGWQPARTPVAERHREDLLRRVGKAFEADPLDDEAAAVGAVFKLINKRITPGEVLHVRLRLPKQLRNLWPE